MATSYPGSNDTFPSQATLAADTLATVPHSKLHGDLGDAVHAIEVTVGNTNAFNFALSTTTVNGHPLSSNVTVTKSDIGLGSVENTALSAWPGSANITIVGTLASGSIPYSLLTGTPSVPSPANPTASVGISTINGVAATFMRSDGAPSINQAIAPVWTGVHTFATAARSGTAAGAWHLQTAPDTTITASTEAINAHFGGNSSTPPTTATRQWATGALALQRENLFVAPTYAAVGGSTFTEAATVYIDAAPIAGTSVTITKSYALHVASGTTQFGGNVGFDSDGTLTLGSGNRPSICAYSLTSSTGATGAGIMSWGNTRNDLTTFQLGSSGRFDWCSNSSANSGGADSGFRRLAPQVVCSTDGTSSGKGWLQNSAGRARMTADLTNATATFSNLTDLTITLIAGRKYFGRLVLKCANSAAAEGIQFDFNGGTATMTQFWAAIGVQASGGTDTLGTNISTSLAGVLNYSVLTGETVLTIEFSLVCNAAGTLIPRFAENTTAVGTATVRLGSWLLIEDSPN